MTKKKAKKRKHGKRTTMKPAFVMTEEALQVLRDLDEDEWDEAMDKMLRKALKMDRKRKQFYIA